MPPEGKDSYVNQFDVPLSACSLCGSRDVHPYHLDHNRIRIDRCRSCGIQFMNPQYSDAYLAEFYAGYTVDDPEWDEPGRYCHNFYFSIIEKYAPRRGRVLDIGSGNGQLLEVARDRGWTPVGYDVDSETTVRVSRKTGIEIRCGTFPELDWGQRTFDLVTMHQSLEHLKSPLPYLKVIHDALRDGGLLFVVLPNIHSLSSRLKFWLEKRGLRRRRVGAYYDTSHHLWYYTPQTLTRLLADSGFEVLHMRSGHQARARQSRLKRAFMRNFSERITWKATMLVVARKI